MRMNHLPPTTPTWRDRWLPNQTFLANHPWLKPWTSRWMDRALWRWHPESTARGVAVGLFWAFAIPFGQVLIAAVHCVWWRANIPAAALMTMVTNPLTIGFWLWLAYPLGSMILGQDVQPDVQWTVLPTQWVGQYLWPILMGMGVFAITTSLVGYALVKSLWRLRRWQRALR